jgi:hypothetical protein
MELKALSPPVFGGQCVRCGSRAKQLPWQISTASHWGPCCAACGKLMLLDLLHRRLPDPFTEAELIDALCDRGLSRGEADLWLRDFEKEGYILRSRTGLFWRDSRLDVSGDENRPVVQPSPVQAISMKPRRPKRRYQKLTAEEVRWRCVKFSREIREIQNAEELH